MHRDSTGSLATRLARSVGGLLLGTALGLAVGLGAVVYEARYENRFLESTDDIIGWKAFPIPAGLALGAAAGWRAPVLLAGGGLGGIVGGAAGALVGAIVGNATSDERSGSSRLPSIPRRPWSGSSA